MKPETEQLLHHCRTALLQQSNEQLHTLFVSWFERVVGEDSIEETLDDLCLLLGYGIRSTQSQILYATSTAWWEVEGCADLDGEFECAEVAALQHRLITMPIKQFALLTDLAYHVCVLEAEVEGQPHVPTGQEWLCALAAWLSTGAREPFHQQRRRNEMYSPSPAAHSQLTRKQRRAQQQKLVEQAWQRGARADPRAAPSEPALIPRPMGRTERFPSRSGSPSLTFLRENEPHRTYPCPLPFRSIADFLPQAVSEPFLSSLGKLPFRRSTGASLHRR